MSSQFFWTSLKLLTMFFFWLSYTIVQGQHPTLVTKVISLIAVRKEVILEKCLLRLVRILSSWVCLRAPNWGLNSLYCTSTTHHPAHVKCLQMTTCYITLVDIEIDIDTVSSSV